MTRLRDPMTTDDTEMPSVPDPNASRPRGLGLAYWALMFFSAACILTGVVIGWFGPALFPAKPVAMPCRDASAVCKTAVIARRP